MCIYIYIYTICRRYQMGSVPPETQKCNNKPPLNNKQTTRIELEKGKAAYGMFTISSLTIISEKHTNVNF